MDFAKAFSYVFEDPDWVKKVAIVALVSLIPVVGLLVVFGWSLEVTRRVIQRDPTPLPDLRFGDQLSDGFRAFLVGLGYAVPVFILQSPIIISSLVIDPNNGGGEMAPALTILAVCCSSLVVIYAILLAFILPAAYGNFVAQNRVGAAFKFQQVIGLVRSNPGAYLMTFLGVVLAGFIGSIGTIACVIGAVFTYTYAMAIQGHLYGQAYLASVRNQAYQ
jgi:hypothetical protein